MKRIYQMSVLFILLLEVNFFSLINTPEWFIDLNSYHRKKLILILTIGLFLFTIIVKKIDRTKFNRKYRYSIIFFVISLVIISLFSANIYNQSIIDVFGNAYFYWIILLYFFLTYFCLKNESNFTFLINSIILIGIAYSTLLTFQYIFTKNGFGNFLVFHEETLVMLSTDSNPRIARPADFIAFSSALLLAKTLWETGKKLKIFMCIGLAINVLYIIIVSQTRIYVLALLFAFFVTFFSTKTAKKNLKNFFFVLMSILLATFLAEFIIEFFFTFTSGDRLSSTIIRIEEFKFYSRQVFKNVIFGRGFIHSTLSENILINYGPRGLYNSSDIGIVGFLSIFGLLGVIFLIQISNNILETHQRLKRNTSFYRILFICIVNYSLVVSFTAFYTDMQRIIYLPIFLTILEYIYNKAILD